MSSLKEKFLKEFRNENGKDIVFKEISEDFFTCELIENNVKYFVSIIFYQDFVSIIWQQNRNGIIEKHRLEKPSYYFVKEKNEKLVYSDIYFLYGKQYSKEDFLKHPDNKKIIAKKRFLNNQ